MKELYSHKVLTSFYLWFDHNLLDRATAHSQVSTPFYYTPDSRVSDDYLPFSSPFKQWVADSSVAGVTIPSGVSGNAGVFIGRVSGAKLDWDNGRILLPASGYTENDSISGSYSIKDFNTYCVNSSDQHIILEGQYQLNSRYNLFLQSGVSPFGYSAPACFIMNTSSDNKPFAFGGMQDTKNKMRVIVATDDMYALDGCISLFRDLTESNIPLLNLADTPFNEYGDLKSGSYNYNQLATDRSSHLIFLEKVTATKVNTPSNQKINPNLKFGIIDFYLSDPRVPKLEV